MMMKRYAWIFVFFFCGGNLLWADETSRHASAREILEIGLTDLKDSGRQLAQRNNLLRSEIKIYRENIRHLRAELEFLQGKKDNPVQEIRIPTSDEKKNVPDWKEGVAGVEENIRRLERQIDALSSEDLRKAFQLKKNGLLDSLKKSEQEIRNAEAAIISVNEGQDPGFAVHEEDALGEKFAVLQAENRNLKKQLFTLEQTTNEQP